MAIEFYHAKDRYACLSNFSPHPFRLDGAEWPTVEHFFQAAKFPGHAHAERIRRAATPREAKRLGRTRQVKLRADWEQVKDDLMRRAVLAKFTQHADLRAILLDTGEEVLVENSPIDSYWGAGRSGDGRNMLGVILMEVRNTLRGGKALADGGLLRYIVGDATAPVGRGAKILVHVCNDLGRWGRGFVLAVSQRWPQTKARFLKWHGSGRRPPFELGRVQFVKVAEDLWVANVIGQHGLRKERGVPPVRYEAIREGLRRVAQFARRRGASVHMPRIACGLAGGQWDRIEPILRRTLCRCGIHVTVYDLEER